MELVRELWSFVRAKGKVWMLPFFLMMGVFGALLLLTQGTAIAPFIYTLF